jgi:hypothetical protein
MLTTANFEVYLQALGGKFIGQNAFKPAEIKVHLFINGKEHPLPYFSKATTSPDDGEVSSDYVDGESSVVPILTNHQATPPVPVTINFLKPTPGLTVVAKGSIALIDANEVAELVVYYPIPWPDKPAKTLTIRQPMILNELQTSYKTTVVIPGLLVHTIKLIGNQLSAVVTMMCGCKVSNGSTPPYWLPSDFEVAANVVYKNGQKADPLRLSLSTSGATSTFEGALTNTSDIESITVIANQQSTGNFGFNRLNC